MGNMLEKLFGKDNMQILFQGGCDYDKLTRNEGNGVHPSENLSEAYGRRWVVSQ
jgi:hypothetical protein